MSAYDPDAAMVRESQSRQPTMSNTRKWEGHSLGPNKSDTRTYRARAVSLAVCPGLPPPPTQSRPQIHSPPHPLLPYHFLTSPHQHHHYHHLAPVTRALLFLRLRKRSCLDAPIPAGRNGRPPVRHQHGMAPHHARSRSTALVFYFRSRPLRLYG
jgi:hypothetical protein